MMAKGFSKHRLKILRVASGPEKCRLNVSASCRRKTLCKTSLISEIHKPEQNVKKNQMQLWQQYCISVKLLTVVGQATRRQKVICRCARISVKETNKRGAKGRGGLHSRVMSKRRFKFYNNGDESLGK